SPSPPDPEAAGRWGCRGPAGPEPVASPPMGIRGFERRLERVVEGAFARAFRSGLRPVELGRRLVREMDDNRSVGVRGETLVPNHFTIALSESDLEQFEGVQDSLSRELADAAREHARDEGYSFLGPVEIELEHDPKLRT